MLIPEPQPYVRVGEAAAGTGTATITPETAYQGETGHDFRIFYNAPGPMYGSRSSDNHSEFTHPRGGHGSE